MIGGIIMTTKRLLYKMENYVNALNRLAEAIEVENANSLVQDAVVKRFEFTYELAWKLLKAFIEFKGIADVRFPRDVFREAFAGGIIKNGEIWLDMMKDRNLTIHNYTEEGAKEIYLYIKEIYYLQLKELQQFFEREFGNEIWS